MTNKFIISLKSTGVPHFAKFTNAVPTYTIFSLCTREWGIFALAESLEQSHLREFFSSPKIRIPQF
jgi:hypothetical protein